MLCIFNESPAVSNYPLVIYKYYLFERRCPMAQIVFQIENTLTAQQYNYLTTKVTFNSSISMSAAFMSRRRLEPNRLYSTRVYLSIDVSSITVRLISTQLGWFQHFRTNQITCQNSISTFFEKKIKFLGYLVVVLVKTFLFIYIWYIYIPIYIDIYIYQLLYCRTDIDKAIVISAYRQKSKYKSKLNFDLFLKKKSKFLSFHVVVLMKTYRLVYQLRS